MQSVTSMLASLPTDVAFPSWNPLTYSYPVPSVQKLLLTLKKAIGLGFIIP